MTIALKMTVCDRVGRVSQSGPPAIELPRKIVVLDKEAFRTKYDQYNKAGLRKAHS
jgi:hypothetical protein